MQDSGGWEGPQKCGGENPMFIHCTVLEIQLFFLILSSKASCFIEASHLVEDIQNNSCISRLIQCVNTGLHPYVSEDLHIVESLKSAK